MTGISNFLVGLSQNLTAVLVTLLVLCVLVVIYMVYMGNKALKDAAKKKAPPKIEDPKVLPPTKRLPPLGGRLSEHLSLKGFFRVSELSLSFLNVLAFLRQVFSGINYKYRLPWYLMVGAEDCGKNALIKHAAFRYPAKQPEFSAREAKPPIKWWFFNKGLIAQLRGDFFISKTGIKSDEISWRQALSLFARYRSDRPLDGILLCLPVSEFYGPSKLSNDEIHDRAKFVSQKLLAMQRSLGLRLPVYIILTKSDILSGFQQFCQALPNHCRFNMLGWSNPYTVETAYQANWILQAFDNIKENLLHLQLELFTQNRNINQHEGLFVFPNEVGAIQTPLQEYLNLLFQDSTFEESLLLRGIYLTGDSGFGLTDTLVSADIDEVDIKQKSDSKKLNPTGVLDPLNQICFVNDLLTEKVFKESGLAKPIAKRVFSANRSLQIAKLSTASFAVIGTFGLMHANEKFSQHKEMLLPILGKMNTALRDINLLEAQQTKATREEFNEYAKQLIAMMDEIETTSFRSIFLPPSWLSSFQKNLQHSVKVSYDQIILRTIYFDLILKSRELLNMRPTHETRSTSLAQLLNPLTSTEYVFFSTYVNELSELLKHVKKFNTLKESTTADDLAELIKYSLGGELPKEFYKHYRRFRQYLVEIVYDPISLDNQEMHARETAHILFTNFLYGVFSQQDVFSILGRVNFILEKYSQQKLTNEPLEIAPLAQFAQELSQGMQSLPDPGQTWMDASFFDPGANANPTIPSSFMELITKIQENPLLGSSVVEDMAQEAAEAFSSFQKGLMEFNTSLGSSMDVEASLNIKAGANPPSKGLFQLNIVLSRLFSQGFMQPVKLQPFITHIPDTKVFFWDTKLIQKAADMAREQDDFMKRNLSSFPAFLQASIKDIILKNSQDQIITLIARAQHLSDVNDHSQNQSSEEVVRAKLNGYKDVSDNFIHLLEVLSKGNISSTYLELRSMLGQLASNLLSRVDAVFKTYDTYLFKDNTFDWWDGDKESSFEAFSVKDKEDLKHYLEQQRNVVSLWATQYAQPVLQFLTSSTMKDEKNVNQKLVNKWSRISEQLQAFQKSKPNNSLFRLEDFILNQLTTISLKDVFDRVPLSEAQTESGDYFLDTMMNLKRALLSKGEVLKRQQSITNYTQLVELFNQGMLNKFPFVSSNLTRNQGEAEPEDIKEFFKKYKEFGNSPQAILDQLHQVRDLADEPLAFLKMMEKVKVFFESYLSASSQDDGPSFDFSIDFRVNKAREKSANHVVDWTFNSNDSLQLSNHDKLKTGRWTFGDPITLTFRWASSSDLIPTKDRAQPLMGVDDKTAIYKYPGRWSLLWLIRLQSAVSGDFNSMNDPTPYTLKFVAPLGARKKAVLFNRVTIMAPAKGKAPGKVLEVPVFPVKAPALSDKVEEIKEKAVITLGLMENAEEEEEQPSNNDQNLNDDKDDTDDSSDQDASEEEQP